MTKIADRREGMNKKKGMVVSIIVNLLIVMGLWLTIGKGIKQVDPPENKVLLGLLVEEENGVKQSERTSPKKKATPKKQAEKPLVKNIKSVPEKAAEVLTTVLEKEAKVVVAAKEGKNTVQKEAVVETRATLKGKLSPFGKGSESNIVKGLGADRAIVKRCGDFLKAAKSIQADGEVVFIVDVDAAGNVVAIKQKSSSIDSGALIARTSECVSNYKYTPKAGASIQRGLVTVSYKYR